MRNERIFIFYDEAATNIDEYIDLSIVSQIYKERWIGVVVFEAMCKQMFREGEKPLS